MKKLQLWGMAVLPQVKVQQTAGETELVEKEVGAEQGRAPQVHLVEMEILPWVGVHLEAVAVE